MLNEITGQINQSNRNAVCRTGDVAEDAYAQALVDLAEKSFDGLDGAFYNATKTGDMGSIPDKKTDNWYPVMAVTLNSGLFAAKAQLPALRKRGGCSIVFTSSFVRHRIGLPGMAANAAAKAGLTGITPVLAAEHGPASIRVNTLFPRGTNTLMAAFEFCFRQAALQRCQPFRRSCLRRWSNLQRRTKAAVSSERPECLN